MVFYSIYTVPPRVADDPGGEVEKLVDYLQQKINFTNLPNYRAEWSFVFLIFRNFSMDF